MLFRPGNGSGIERPATKALREGPRGNANAARAGRVCPALFALDSGSWHLLRYLRFLLFKWVLHWTSQHQAPSHQTRAAHREPPRYSRPPLKPVFSPIVQIIKERRPNELPTTDIPQTSHLAPARASSFFLSLRSRRDPPPLAPFPFPSRTESRSRIPGRKSCSASRIAPVRPSSNRTDRTTPPSFRTTSSSTSPLPLTTATASEITVGSFRSEPPHPPLSLQSQDLRPWVRFAKPPQRLRLGFVSQNRRNV